MRAKKSKINTAADQMAKLFQEHLATLTPIQRERNTRRLERMSLAPNLRTKFATITMAERTFTAREAARITKVPYASLDYWARTRLIVPSVDANGSGTDRCYDFSDLVALRVTRELRQAGISTQSLRQVVQHLREHGWPKALSQLRLVGVGSQVCVVRFVRGCKELNHALTGQGIFAFMVDFEQTVVDVRQGINDLSQAA